MCTKLLEERVEHLALVMLDLTMLHGKTTQTRIASPCSIYEITSKNNSFIRVVALNGLKGSGSRLILGRLGAEPEEDVVGTIGMHRVEHDVRVARVELAIR